MATFTLEIPDVSVERVTTALCKAGGFAEVNITNSTQTVKNFIVATVANVERQEAAEAALAAMVLPDPVQL